MKRKIIIISVVAALLVALAVPAIAATTDNPALDWFKQRMEARKTYIDQAVQNGQLTTEQGQSWKDHIDQMVQFHEQNGFVGPAGGPGFRCGGSGAGPGFGGQRGGGYCPGWSSGLQTNPTGQNAQ